IISQKMRDARARPPARCAVRTTSRIGSRLGTNAESSGFLRSAETDTRVGACRSCLLSQLSGRVRMVLIPKRQSMFSRSPPSLFSSDGLLVDRGNHIKVIQDVPDQGFKVRNISRHEATEIGMRRDVTQP